MVHSPRDPHVSETTLLFFNSNPVDLSLNNLGHRVNSNYEFYSVYPHPHPKGFWVEDYVFTKGLC
jgi:hypothetical protein